MKFMVKGLKKETRRSGGGLKKGKNKKGVNDTFFPGPIKTGV